MPEPTPSPSIEPLSPDIEAWLSHHGWGGQIRHLAGDVSARHYFRVAADGRARQTAGTAILALYPPELEGAYRRFLRTTALLEGAGVRVPRILAEAPSTIAGLRPMVVEDLGPQTLYEQARKELIAEAPPQAWAPWIAAYHEALEILRRFRGLDQATAAGLQPPLGRSVLRRELDQTWRTFLVPSGLVADTGLRRRLETALETVLDHLGAEAQQVPCHRDFMVRNLVPLPTGMAVFDHQDLRLGPWAYDLASLLNDSLFPPPDLEEALLTVALQEDFGLAPSHLSHREALEQYHRTAVQRTLKAVGTYAAFAARGSDTHVALIPGTLRRAIYHLEALPEGQQLARELPRAWRRTLGGEALC